MLKFDIFAPRKKFLKQINEIVDVALKLNQYLNLGLVEFFFKQVTGVN